GAETAVANGQPAQARSTSTPSGSVGASTAKPSAQGAAANAAQPAAAQVEKTVSAAVEKAKQLGYSKAKAGRKTRPVQQTLPFAESQAEQRRARSALRDEVIDELKKRGERAARAGKQRRASSEFSRAEEAVARMAVEIGLTRAAELLQELRRRAKSL